MSKGQTNQTEHNKFHIAIAVSNIPQSIEDYSNRLGCRPQIVVKEEYALWRTDFLNFSIRKTDEAPGLVRHLGWEDPQAQIFTADIDCNGLKWERFNEQNQLEEIKHAWPDA